LYEFYPSLLDLMYLSRYHNTTHNLMAYYSCPQTRATCRSLPVCPVHDRVTYALLYHSLWCIDLH